ncbi:helix-turn-helix transcriptional regulator [Falcatimonas sp. MSJ-15]|uniref:helix-turn-helix domain-containing protein n=1 Tax=Falcatimonas sp. MSJ-15 TaxID=2841515 RepID=UPI001C0F534C|nr:helix-turn-helix transcriptional regulator [Falcatimonas sp. MSJ-15]MBU5470285.1 helix-turn-helix transcriptional regulator [Falcatimonas sp. MSJ-15]
MSDKRAKINYKPLWKMLIDKDMTKSELRKVTSISRSTMAKMVNNEYVAMNVLVRICIALNCSIDNIVEIERKTEEE